jgi:hypothetical protein
MGELVLVEFLLGVHGPILTSGSLRLQESRFGDENPTDRRPR